MKAHRYAAWLALFGAVSGGCILLVGSEPALRSSAADAAVDSAAEVDAATDTSAAPGDAAPPDADADAAPDAAASSCGDTFADSFDVGALGARWDGLQQAGAKLSLDSTDAKSAPNALLVAVPADGGAAFLRKHIGPAKTVCAETWIKLNAGSLWTAQLTGPGNYQLVYQLEPTGTSEILEVYAPISSTVINRIVGTFAAASTAWHRVRVEVAFPAAAGKGTLQVFFDGKLSLTSAIGGDTYDLSLDEFDLGAPYSDPSSGPRTVRFDDFGLHAQ